MSHGLDLDGEHGAPQLHGRRMQIGGNRRRQLLWPANRYVGPQCLHLMAPARASAFRLLR